MDIASRFFREELPTSGMLANPVRAYICQRLTGSEIPLDIALEPRLDSFDGPTYEQCIVAAALSLQVVAGMSDRTDLSPLLEQKLSGGNLSFEQARVFAEAFSVAPRGSPVYDQAVAIYSRLGLGMVPEEAAGWVAGLLHPPQARDLPIATSGMGGDGYKTVNISTPASLISAANGARIAKHGAPAVTGVAGSTDFMLGMGFPVNVPTRRMSSIQEEKGFGYYEFLLHNPAGLTAFMVLAPSPYEFIGPMTTPVPVKGHLCGTKDMRSHDLVVQTYQQLLARGFLPEGFRVLVATGTVDGKYGIDELVNTGANYLTEVTSQGVYLISFYPEDIGLPTRDFSEIASFANGYVTDRLARLVARQKNIEAVRSVLEGQPIFPGIADVLTMNAAAQLALYDGASGEDLIPAMAAAVPQVRESLANGQVRDYIGNLRQAFKS